MTLHTTFDFTLPRGYLDAAGQLHRQGTMRLARAVDEIQAMQDARVQANETYLPVLLLSRVVTQLGSLNVITPQVIEGVFASDLAYLEDLYLHLNSAEALVVGATCPVCGSTFPLQVAPIEQSAEALR
jgi:hypothetical protein